MNVLLPLFLLFTICFACVRGAHVYDAFVRGAKGAIGTTLRVFPCLVAIFVMLELMNASGITSALVGLCQPLFTPLGIPAEITELLLLRPLSGSGALAVTERIISTLGPDTYAARCAAVIMGGSETVMYVVAVYFSASKAKKTGIVVPASLLSSFLAAVLACALLRVM